MPSALNNISFFWSDILTTTSILQNFCTIYPFCLFPCKFFIAESGFTLVQNQDLHQSKNNKLNLTLTTHSDCFFITVFAGEIYRCKVNKYQYVSMNCILCLKLFSFRYKRRLISYFGRVCIRLGFYLTFENILRSTNNNTHKLKTTKV